MLLVAEDTGAHNMSCAQWLPKSTNFGELQGSFLGGGRRGDIFLLFRGFQALEPKAKQ